MKKLFLLAVFGIAGFSSYKSMGQDSLYNRNKRELTVGFTVGGRYMFNSPLFNKSLNFKNKSCCHYTEGMFLKKYITEHMAIETGLNYMTAEAPVNYNPERVVRTGKEYTVSIPATAQYYIRPSKARLNTYVGAGVNYNYTTQTNTVRTETGNKNQKNVTTNVNIAVVQGVIYQVNTKIQVRESIHFIPSNQNNCQEVGFNIGVGYKF